MAIDNTAQHYGLTRAWVSAIVLASIDQWFNDKRLHLSRTTMLPGDDTVYNTRPDYAPTDRERTRLVALGSKHPQYCTHLLMTNGDNYYQPTFLSKTLEAFKEHPEAVLAATDFIHRYIWWHDWCCCL